MTENNVNESRPTPPGFPEMVREFTDAAIKASPTNMHQFAVDYFTQLRDSQPLRVIPEDDDVTPQQNGVRFQESTEASGLPSGLASEKQAGVRYGRRASVCAESYDPSIDSDVEHFFVHPKTDIQRQRLTDSVAGILLFRALDGEQMQRVVDAMFERRVKKGEHVIDQGDDGDNFYVVDSGKFDTLVTRDRKSRSVCQFDGKGFFGELALMYNMPRAATIIALTDGVLWAMDRASFRHVVLHSAFKKRTMYEQLLESVPMLKHLDDYERMNLADALMSKKYGNGERIIREGDAADGMYFVEEGQVRVTIRKSGREVDVSKVAKGKYFGEKALVENSPRTASVYALGNVSVAFLERESFERLLGPCINIMKREMKTYKKSS